MSPAILAAAVTAEWVLLGRDGRNAVDKLAPDLAAALRELAAHSRGTFSVPLDD